MKKMLHRLLRIKFYINYIYYKLFIYKYENIISQQLKLFELCGLSRESGYFTVNKLCNEILKESYDENIGLFSEHLILLGSISENPNLHKNIKRILEIGTFNGKTALLISKLFPNAEITTIDLEDDSTDLKNSYQRSNTLKDFIEKRNVLLRNESNIQFIQMNSLNLINFDSEIFDLIWVDGAHGYPVVTSDIVNAIRICKNGGFILIDDVMIKTKKNDPMYRSTAAYETLVELRKSKVIDEFFLFNKRLSPKFNFTKKFIGFIQK